MKTDFSTCDELLNTRLPEQIGDMYIKIHSLCPHTLSQTSIGNVVDWESAWGWFDELVPIYRRRAAELEWA
jgi:hypothetical protein